MKSVLVFCPVHPEKGLHPRTEAAVQALNYPRRDVWYSYGDNPYAHASPITEGRLNVLHQYEKARAWIINGAWDYLLTIESDMIPPPEIIERLIACDADIAYSLYCFRRSHGWSAFQEFHLGRGRSMSHYPDVARKLFGQVIEVPGLGLGATLIKRGVFDVIEFRGFFGTACDGYFALDAQKNGFSQRCDTGCISGHIDDEIVLWPDISAPDLCRVEVI